MRFSPTPIKTIAPPRSTISSKGACASSGRWPAISSRASGPTALNEWSGWLPRTCPDMVRTAAGTAPMCARSTSVESGVKMRPTPRMGGRVAP